MKIESNIMNHDHDISCLIFMQDRNIHGYRDYMTLTEGIYMYHGNKGGSDDRHIMPMSTLLIRNNNSKHCTFLGLVTNKR